MKIAPNFGILLGLCIVLLSFNQSQSVPIRNNFTGKTIKVLNKIVRAYLGIPFATPPVGKLRFREPRPLRNKDTPYNATRKPPSCMQDSPYVILEWIDRYPKDLSEDCLYLNIWVPTSKQDKPFATMVWIYGGAFILGSSNMNIYDGAVITAIGDVIVVSFNYRLSSFGYANFNKEDARGNMGMLDQVMALKWIRENIETFGGDKDLITVFGESAGAISAAHHLVSPLTKRLFKRAILQSGSNYLDYFAVKPAFNVRVTSKLAQEVGCDRHNMLKCMQDMDASKLAAAEKVIQKRKNLFMLFHPQMSPPFLSEDSFSDVDNGNFHDVEVLMGEVKDEGSLFVAALNPELLIHNVPVFTKDDAKSILGTCYELSGEYLDGIADHFFGKLADDDYSGILKQTIKGIGDVVFTCPIFHLAEKLAEYNRTVYHYTFNHTRIKSIFKKWMGVPHFEDVHFVFGRPLIKNKSFTPEEAEFSRMIIELWTSFAKTGKPSYNGMEQEWKPFDRENRNSLSLTLGNIHPVKAEEVERCTHWKNFMKEYSDNMFKS
ncbi:acetylcholinesterase-like [Centruroides vittatus]|uniref:acetylcholinesterase-like n=1 Tax=Centruroides vittatus TaxID=120091 RepID=UPI00350F9130